MAYAHWKRFEDLTNKQRLWFLSLAYTDIEMARTALACMLAIRNAPGWETSSVYNCIHDAAIVRYVRPFCGCNLFDEQKKVRLPNDIAFGGEIPPAMHTEVMSVRHRIVAHTDMQAKEVRVHRKPNAVDGAHVWSVETSGLLFHLRWAAGFLEHCTSVIQRLHAVVQPLMAVQMGRIEIGSTRNLRDLDV